ncbi:glycosyltransferase [Aerococcus urinaeequi]|uniref:glycosyltransferase n=1 Tax=Aerococcus urinaeequi TaxID=51665 RepID=UPI003AB087EF
MSKILIVLPSLGAGGAERVVTHLLNHFTPNKYEIYLVLLREPGEFINDIPKEIKLINLNGIRTRYVVKGLLDTINKIKPDIIFSTLRGVSVILSFLRPFISQDTYFIYREENTASTSIQSQGGIYKYFYNWYYKNIYKKATQIICQSKFMQTDLIETYNIPNEKLIKIYNPVDFQKIENSINHAYNPYPDSDKKNILIVGRLTYQKGIDNVIESINNNKEKFIQNKFHLNILGDGELLTEYKNMVDKYELNQMITFHGKQSNPYMWMKYCDLFLLPSRFEGLPNVLLEALACGCNTIVTNHPGGTKELMEIVGREDNVVEELTWDKSWLNESSTIDINGLKKIFDVNIITSKYEEIFDKYL